MVIQIRGTGGAGKSHLVRAVMTNYTVIPAFLSGRMRPISYICERPGHRSLFVPGHYETPTGGCDTIQKPDDVYVMVQHAAAAGHDVLYEGIMIGDDVRRCVDLHRIEKVLVIALNTPIEECLAGIQQRRDTRGDERPLNPKNTRSRADRLRKSMMPRLKDAGVDARWLSREDAFKLVIEKLEL